jgi:hypothetical protein
MKKIFLKLWGTGLALALAATSCITDEKITGGGDEPGVPVVISFAPGVDGTSGTRATNEGNTADRTVEHIRVILYNASTGRFAGEYATAATPGEVIEIEVLTGTYDVVFVANGTSETTGGSLAGFFSSRDNYDRISKLKGALVSASAFGNDRSIPMFCIERGVHVIGQRHVWADREYKNTDTDPWKPTLTRTGVRLSFEVTLSPTQFADWTSKRISVSRVPGSMWLEDSGKLNDSPRESSARSYEARETANPENPQPVAGADGYWWKNEGTTDADDTYIVRFDRIIVPELLFSPRNAAAKAMLLAITLGQVTLDGEICAPAPATSTEGYTMPRNTWLHLDVRVSATKLLVEPEIIPWNTAEKDGGILGNKSRVTVESPVYIAAETASRLATVSTNVPTVTDFDIVTNGTTVKAKNSSGTAVDWITSVAKSGTVSATTIDGLAGITRSLNITVDVNPGDTRTAYIEVKAGGTSRFIEVVQSHRGVLASPGVVGYIASGPHAGVLTLRGSREYAGTPVETHSPLGEPVLDETVYAACFKWGSLTALSSQRGDGSLGAEDIVAIPPAYSNMDTTDPCAFYFDPGWRQPTGGGEGVGWNRGASFGRTEVVIPPEVANPDWSVAEGEPGYGAGWIEEGTEGVPVAGIVAGDGKGARDWSMFLPAAGYRNSSTGAVEGSMTDARYWSATPKNSTGGYTLTSDKWRLNPIGDADFNRGYTVRCVRE